MITISCDETYNETLKFLFGVDIRLHILKFNVISFFEFFFPNLFQKHTKKFSK